MHVATDMFQTDPALFVADLAAAVATPPSRDWSNRWIGIAEESSKTIVNQLNEMEEMFEGKIFNQLATLLPSKATLFAGNSMPVRDLDSFFPLSSQEIRFLANRGASGIDGIVSTALGASAVTQEPTVLVLGDLSFYHDMNGLLAAKLHSLKLTIVLVNNNGGGIFSFLPQRDYPESFEKYFATPHGLTFQAAASLYGLTYSKAASWEEFRGLISRSMELSGSTIVELQTNRDKNVALHRRIWSAVAEAAEGKLAELT
jgi:2-succinyl-5-enolpyruvyl-6-hydroxy-3-cyclohexene-1-carboxylate synthase